MPTRIFELPVHPGPFPWSHIVPSDSEANGSFGFSHQKLAENYTGDQRVLPAVTGFVGGGTALDGVATANGATATLATREVVLGRSVYRYQLQNGADAESVPEVIRPDDYDAGTNNRVWRLVVPANRNQMAGVAGVAGSFWMNVAGCNLGTDPWTAWMRLHVNYRAVNTAAMTRLLNTTSGAGVTLTIEAGALVLTALSASATTEATATLAGFVDRYADAVVDLALVRAATANPANHEIQVWCNAEQILAVTISAARNYGFNQFDPLVQNSPEWVTYRAVLFNRALSAAEIYRLSLRGIETADQWGAVAAGHVADWSAGVNGWVSDGGGTLAGNLDGLGIPSTDNVLRYTVPATPGGTQYVGTQINVLPGAAYGLVRVRGQVWLPDTNTGADEVRLVCYTLNPYGPDSVRLAGRSAGWVGFDVVVNCRANFSQLRFHLAFAAGTGTQVAGDTLHLAAVTVQRVGAIVDADLSFGAGRWIPDRSPNGFSGLIPSNSNSFTRWVIPRMYGQAAVVLNLGHSAISATAGSTILLRMPANAALLRVELERTAAFDSGITLVIGSSGDDDRYGAATAVDSVGSTLVNSLIQTVESATNQTIIYLRKSGSTTVGNLRARIVYELRGNPPPVA